jgi:hypothetical protein
MGVKVNPTVEHGAEHSGLPRFSPDGAGHTQSCGFGLGGFDAYLYRGVMPGTHEIVLFWYLLF